MRGRRRRSPQALPSARRHVGVRRAGAHGAAVQPALSADRWPGKLRLGRWRSSGRVSIHRVQVDAAGGADARGHRQGHRRFHSELRRSASGARDSAGAVSEPAGERLRRHRGRDGDQHPAAQSRRDLRRAAGVDQQTRHHARGNSRHRARPRFSDRRAIAGPQGDPRGLPHRPRHAHHAGSGGHRDRQAQLRARRSSFARFRTR